MDYKQQIKELALRKPREEICGFIVKANDDFLLFESRNEATNEKKYFVTNAYDYLSASKAGEIVAVFHTHPNSIEKPSILDVINSENHNINYIIYSLKSDKFLEYKPCGNKFLNMFLGKSFEIGVNDCFTLVRDFFKVKYGFNIHNVYRDKDWRKANKDLIKTEQEKSDFVEVKDLQEDDILAFSLDKKSATHLGIYLGNNCFLHQPRNHFSKIDLVDGVFSKKLKYIFRHKKLC